MEIIQNRTKMLSILLIAIMIVSLCMPIFATEEQISEEESKEVIQEITQEQISEEEVKEEKVEENKEETNESLPIFEKLKSIVLDKDFMSDLLNKLKNVFAKVLDFFRRLLDPIVDDDPVEETEEIEEEFKIEINVTQEAIEKVAEEFNKKGYKVVKTNENEYYIIICAGEKPNPSYIIRIKDTKYEDDTLTLYVEENQYNEKTVAQVITYPYCIAKYNKEVKNIKIVEVTENTFDEM